MCMGSSFFISETVYLYTLFHFETAVNTMVNFDHYDDREHQHAEKYVCFSIGFVVITVYQMPTSPTITMSKTFKQTKTAITSFILPILYGDLFFTIVVSLSPSPPPPPPNFFR